MKLSTITIKGKEIKYRDARDLSKKADISIPVAIDAINKWKNDETNTRIAYAVDVNGDLQMFKYDISEYKIPLIKRQFGLRKEPSSSQYTTIKDKIIQNKIVISEVIDDPRNVINVTGRVVFDIDFGSQIVRRRTIFIHHDSIRELYNTARQAALAYGARIPGVGPNDIYIISIIIDGQNGSEDLNYDWDNMVIQDTDYELSQWSNINYVNNIKDENCLSKYFKDNHNIEIYNEQTIKDIISFCDNNNINYNFYSIDGKLRFSNNDKTNKDIINCIFYNNHIYPLNGKKPIPRDKIYNEIKLTNDIDKEIDKLLKKKIMPYDLTFDFDSKAKSKISSYTYNSIKYIDNNEYADCYCILLTFDLTDKIHDTIKVKDLGSIIEKKYIDYENDCMSFFPLSTHSKGAFNYDVIPDGFVYDIDDIYYIDKNLCYTSVLKTLLFLIKVDWRIATINKINKPINETKIIDYNLYIVNVNNNYDILYPNNDIYCGTFLNLTKIHRPDIIIVEEIECQYTKNYYSEMIKDMFEKKIDKDAIKSIFNILIGKFQKDTYIKDQYDYKGIFNIDESNRTSGLKVNINNKFNVIYESTKNVSYINNRKPIAIQIKDMSRLMVFNQMIEHRISLDNILQIKTDAILFKGSKPNINLDPVEGWKFLDKSTIKKIIPSDEINEANITFSINFNSNAIRILHSQYAGCGKTYYISNVLVPKLQESKTTYIVLTPSYCALEEYMEKKINCRVVQYFDYNTEIPIEDYIIIDEIGMMGKKSHDFLCKLLHIGKKYECFGDFHQLPPPDTGVSFGTEHYLKYLFSDIKEEFNNYRNNFPKEYYDSLIYSNDKNYLIREVIKYSTKNYKDAEIIITYRNINREKWNNLIMAEDKLSYNTKGLKLFCDVNKDRYKAFGVYNGFPLYVNSSDDKYYYLVNNMNDIKIKIKCNHKQITEDFNPRFAMNVYNIQGKTIKSYYWDQNDNHFINGPIAYTIISRLKGNVYKP